MPAERDQRQKSHGVVYTPLPIVRHILRHTLDAICESEAGKYAVRILDPACGDGAFLVEAYERLLRRADEGQTASPMARLEIARRHVFGVDIDETAVAQTRLRLAAMAYAGCDGATSDDHIRLAAEALRRNIICGDALASAPAAAWLRAEAFSVIVSNPPYVGFRQLAKRDRDDAAAAGATSLDGRSGDLYVQFVERILELLAPGGRFGLIVPNKFAIADYARGRRAMLLSHTRLDRLDDISRENAFASVGVYPIILCGAKVSPTPSHRVLISRPRSWRELGAGGEDWTIAQSQIDAARGFPLRPRLDLESRVATRPLGDLAVLHSGATGFTAGRLAEALVEQDASVTPAWDFITSGSIDRYAIHAGDVRFMGRTFRRPVLPTEASLLTDRKRRLYREPKIVFAGMSRRLEAAWSEAGLALGVQVYAAADLRDDPYYLLALLNSKLLAFVFRTRFQAKRLAGGFFSLNKRQLVQLPMRVIEPGGPGEGRLRDELSRAARRLTKLGCDGESAALDGRVDQIVYRLYRLTDDEIETIEADLAEA